MSDDLKLRATVVDQATGPIRDIGRAVRDVARTGSLAPLQREFSGLHGGIAAIGREIRTITIPALAGLGITGGGLIATLTGVSKVIDTIGGKTLDLHHFSREIGFASGQVKAFSAAAERLRIAPEAAQQGLQRFARNVEDIKLNIEGAREELIRHGAGDVVGAIQKSKTNYEALATVVERMQAISRKSPAAGRRFAEQIFGDPAFARMTLAEITAELGKFKDQTEEEVAAAKKFNDNMVDLQRTLGRLQRTVGNELTPAFTELVQEVDAFFSQTGVGQFLADSMREIAREIRGTIKELKDVYEFYRKVRRGLGFSTPDEIAADKTAKATDIERQIAEREGRLGTFDRQQADRGVALGDLPPKLADRRRFLVEEIDLLKKELKTLREEIEKTNGSAKKMSLDGAGVGGGLGGLVVPASLRGGFGGGPAMRGLGGLPGIPGSGGGGLDAGGGTAAGTGTSLGPSAGGLPGTPSGAGGMPTGGMSDAASFDRTFKGTALEGKWPQVEAAAKANGVPPNVMASIMAHETGRGGNLRGNNVAGLMDPATNWMRKQQFGSIDDGITAAGKTIGKNWARAGGDIDRMGRIYAPPGAANDPGGLNSGWAAGVRGFMGGGAVGTLGGYRNAVTNPPLGPVSASDRVRELQGQVAGVRRMPISDTLRAQLDHAALSTGLVAEITSGGQPRPGGGPRVGSTRHDLGGAGDMRLRDPQTGRVLDMRDPADQARMSAFVRESVRAGATGVGAGLGYMGPSMIHVGGGKPAVWGGAGWIRDAYREGIAAGPVKPAPTAQGPAFPRGVTPDDGRERMDKALKTMGGTVSGSATIDVNVKAPKGTVVGAGADGIFRDVSVKRSTQMSPSAEGPAAGER